MNVQAHSPIELSAVLPARNEAENLAAVLTDALAVLTAWRSEFEIVVVDDGSSDGTAELVRRWGRRHPQVRLVSSSTSGGRGSGYGAALRAGFASARGRLVFFTDADGQFHFDRLPAFVRGLDSADLDLVVGYRIQRRDHWMRLVCSNTYNRIASLVCGIRARDINCAYKLIRRDVLTGMNLVRDDYLINVEILGQAATGGLGWRQMGTRHYPRPAGRSKVGGGDIVRTLRGLLEIRRGLRRSRSPKGKSATNRNGMPHARAVHISRNRSR